ncbi:MAG: hypothetical protein IJM30_01020 [Thermoguttaceae bacterium]|nr:hypothetical protein [Thermoguttaceae bacterium]
MADALTQIVQMAQTLELILEQRYQAVGRGLHEKLTSVESEIPERARKQIRYVATLRNKAVHEDASLAEKNLKGLTIAYRSALSALDGGGEIASDREFYGANYGRTFGADVYQLQDVRGGIDLSRPTRPRANRGAGKYPVSPARAAIRAEAIRAERTRVAFKERDRLYLLLTATLGLLALVVILLVLLLATLSKQTQKDGKRDEASSATPSATAPDVPSDSSQQQ